MNCLSCKENDYLLYPKNKNCLKCPKYSNYEQTKCINITLYEYILFLKKIKKLMKFQMDFIYQILLMVL